ncbi:MAG: dihydrodipicolinate synthase family protein [Ktedonobacteraceae bacterium]
MGSLLLNGIYPPLPTFFHENEELDIGTLQLHMHRLVDSGIAGYVLMGSNGEAVHLTSDERVQLVQAAREVIGDTSLVLIVGCGDDATRTTIAHCRAAARHGADLALVLPPFYYKGRMNTQALLAHYRAVADSSPLPILIYNMPGSTAGLDLDAETICALAEHTNIIGVKDSAGNIAKLAQIVASVPDTFKIFAGSAGYLLPALAVGAAGAVSALANVFPQEVCAVQVLFDAGQLDEARALQARLVVANNAVTTVYSVPGLKAALELIAGYGGSPRMPLQPLNVQERAKLAEMLRDIQ